jgi:flagellar L-ring protein precursor FlgH
MNPFQKDLTPMKEFPQYRILKTWAQAAWMPVVLSSLFSIQGLAANGSLWSESSARLLLADNRARHVGDILTIVVEENNESAKQNNTKTAKKTSISASISSFLFGPSQGSFLTRGGKYPSMDMKSDKSFEGGGTINNSERITARIAVRVTEVLPNGHMILEGRRMTLVGGEEQEAVLRGVVRQEDIQPDNSVLSYNVADASIKFVTKGSVTDSQRRGWFTRAFDKVTPF